MKQHILILLIIWGLVGTGLAVYFEMTNQRLQKANQVLLDTVIASRDFAKNSNTSLELLGKCVGNYDTCDAQETKSKLLMLQEDKDKIWSRLQEYDQQLQTLKVWK